MVANEGPLHDGIRNIDGEQPVQASTLRSREHHQTHHPNSDAPEEEGRIAPTPAHTYLPNSKARTWESATADVLSHRAGLQSWIPFYWRHWKTALPFAGAHRGNRNAFRRLLHATGLARFHLGPIVASEVDAVGTHRYSDLGYYAIQRIIEGLTGLARSLYDRAILHPRHTVQPRVQARETTAASIAPTAGHLLAGAPFKEMCMTPVQRKAVYWTRGAVRKCLRCGPTDVHAPDGWNVWRRGLFPTGNHPGVDATRRPRPRSPQGLWF